jgi:hypothetical protein
MNTCANTKHKHFKWTYHIGCMHVNTHQHSINAMVGLMVFQLVNTMYIYYRETATWSKTLPFRATKYIAYI